VKRGARAKRAADAAPTDGDLRGSVLDVLAALLAEQRTDEALAVVKKLLARNHELELQLAKLLSRGKTREGVSSAQLGLFVEGLKKTEGQNDRGDADEELRKASEIDRRAAEAEEKDKQRAARPKKQPPVRRPIPDGLRRVDNPIPLPDDERSCSRCGAENVCIGHDVTEVIDLIPADVIVRRDRREKAACPNCDGALVRAPLGDKVVAGGRFGSRFVGELLIDKYSDGLPLHRLHHR